MQHETALIKASTNGHLPVAEALIQAKADVNARDVSWSIPVFVNRKTQNRSAMLSLTASASLRVSAYEVSNESYLV